MESQENLEIEVGTKEIETLKPEDVEVKEVFSRTVGKKDSVKIVLSVKHPGRDELIEISSVKYEKISTGKLEVSGLWINKDDDGKIRKGSALAIFIGFFKKKNSGEFKGDFLPTVLDDKGYLCFKAY